MGHYRYRRVWNHETHVPRTGGYCANCKTALALQSIEGRIPESAENTSEKDRVAIVRVRWRRIHDDPIGSGVILKFDSCQAGRFTVEGEEEFKVGGVYMVDLKLVASRFDVGVAEEDLIGNAIQDRLQGKEWKGWRTFDVSGGRSARA